MTRTSIFSDIQSGNVAAVHEAVRSGASLDSRDDLGRTALIHVAMVANGNLLDVLLRAGADPNLTDRDGWSALHFAAQAQSSDAIRSLVGHGAQVDAPDNHGNTPLSRAVFAYRGAGDAIATLLTLGADAALQNKHGVSAHDLAQIIANYDSRKFFAPAHN